MKPAIALAALFFVSLLLPGCACPRRQASTTHVREAFTNRDDGLILRETWQDKEGGGGFFLFADPNVQGMTALHTNQSALGGGSVFTAGSLTVILDTNTAAVVAAGGTAIGNIVGAAAKSALK